MNTKSRVRTIATTFVFAIIVLFANAEAARAQSTHYASVTNDGSNRVYEIMRISRDSANWSHSGYEITVRNTYYNGGGIVKAFVGYGYQDSGSVTILQAAGQNQPQIFLGSEVVVSGTIKYVPVNIQVPAWQYFSVEVKFGTTETTSITSSSQVHFTGTSSTTGATGANYDGSVNFTGNVGIGTTSPGVRLTAQGSNGYPATSGASQTGALRIEGSSNSVLDFGSSGASPFGNWIQSTDKSALNYYYPLLLNPNGGNVGIGTTSPGALLSVGHPWSSAYVAGFSGSTGRIGINSTVASTPGFIDFNTNSQTGYVGLNGSAANGFFASNGLASALSVMAPGGKAVQLGEAGAAPAMTIISGNIGIGTTNPQNKLHVAGSITIDGNINAKYQDVAEWVQSSEQLAAGTVVVLDSTKSNQVISSSVRYDTRVAGVISAQPGIALGEKSDSKVLVATTGRVKVKVDASKGAIHIGDLLVTSDVPGVAMRSEPVELAGRKMHMPGTLIGKALEPLAKGSGEILVLLSLQ